MRFDVTTEPIAAASRPARPHAAPPLPTLGEILDRIAAERPDWRVSCDPALRGSRVGIVRVAGR